MTGTLSMHLTCPVCAYETRGIAWATVRPAMRQVLFTVDLGYMDTHCVECRHPLGRSNNSAVRFRPTADTVAAIDAWRERQRARRKKAA